MAAPKPLAALVAVTAHASPTATAAQSNAPGATPWWLTLIAGAVLGVLMQETRERLREARARRKADLTSLRLLDFELDHIIARATQLLTTIETELKIVDEDKHSDRL